VVRSELGVTGIYHLHSVKGCEKASQWLMDEIQCERNK
jgi:hypothetical protein